VVLVGAGPGDPDLITVRGAAALGRADVVLYDSLSTRELLGLAPDHAEWIDVGKRGHDEPTRPQEEINALIVERAREGLAVVRLKGGDPFVFGRGGEEASACAAAGIPCEIVPGVTSALAAPAYAGIPVTDRRYAASFAVVTGHKDTGRPREATRWAQLGAAVDTLVILMGMRNLPDLVEKLLAGGKDPATPSAAVMHGTLGTQRVVVSALAELPARVVASGLGAPSTVVVGDVVGLRESLAWWENEPLFGMRVLVTRALEQSAELASALRTFGAEPVLVPMIALVPPDDPERIREIDAAIDRLADYDGLVFASSNGVRFLAARARERGPDAFASYRGQVFCVGQQTAQAALDAGLPVHLVATGRSDAEGLLAQILQAVPSASSSASSSSSSFSSSSSSSSSMARGRRFLLPRSDIGRTVIADGLRDAGVRVDTVEAYRNIRPPVDAAALRGDLAAGSLSALTFTSPSAVAHFVDLLDDASRRAAGDCVIAAVGSTTAGALRDRGLEPDVIPKRPDARALVEALAGHVLASREIASEGREGEDQ
jgi:uroporphyrinogen III methyltransferase/synthase